jgi:lipoprotein-anchoring transpeptidase ErfK/SrfK
MRRSVLFCLVTAALAAAVIVPIALAQDPAAPAGGPPVAEPPATTEPPPTEPGPPAFVPDGVTIAGVEVGGLTPEAATAAVEAAFAEPLVVTHRKIRWLVGPDRLGARAYVDGAVARALAAPPGSSVELVVAVRGAAVRDWLADIGWRVDRKVKNSTLRLVKLRPRISDARAGTKLLRGPSRAAIIRELKQGERGPVALLTETIKPTVTRSSFGPVVVIRRESKRLHLYRGEKAWRTFGVATGQAAYPTPIGRFQIVTKQRNPWWYPPASDWAEGLEPVPPGPGNPLGTRWMGLSAPLVGIHGTPDAASIGYSASHGCIRMLVSQAEWLFDRVRIGTTVFIVRA